MSLKYFRNNVIDLMIYILFLFDPKKIESTWRGFIFVKGLNKYIDNGKGTIKYEYDVDIIVFAF